MLLVVKSAKKATLLIWVNGGSSEGHVDSNKIRQIIKNLFGDCSDLLEREFVFIKEVAGSQNS